MLANQKAGFGQVYIECGRDLQPLRYPEHKDKYGSQNRVFTYQPPDMARSPRRIH